ncbi:MAG: phage baseplate assembly protein V [Proteobacteria bacterium]|nr:phage baseplate assembly protein V [Pseudomonadota bacterium]MBU1594270.1 phage baseplate assembly protein V [Pseudomonadota bacterium]
MNDPLYRKLMRQIHGLAARCVLRLVNDGLKMQAVQVGLLDGETGDNMERFQNYGHTSVPLPGAEGVALFLGADRAHGVIIAMDDRRYRLGGLAGGEVALYSIDDQEPAGHRIVLKRGGVIEVRGDIIDLRAATRLHLSAPEVEIHADTRREMDVAGYGEALNFEDGVWRTDTYTTGANFAPAVEHGIQPPEVD